MSVRSRDDSGGKRILVTLSDISHVTDLTRELAERRAGQCQRGYGAIMCRLDADHDGDHVSYQLGSRRVWSEEQLAKLRADHGIPPD